MNKTIQKIIIPVCFLGLNSGICTAAPDAMQLQRTISEQIRADHARVHLVLHWEKEVHLHHARIRHNLRARIAQSAVQMQKTQTTCQGILLEGNVQVAAPASCFKYADFSLRQVQLSFSNGKQATASAQSVRLQDDLAYILVKRNVTEGLMGLPVSKLKEGESLQDA